MEVWEISGTLSPFSRAALKKFVEEAPLDIYSEKQLRLMIELHSSSKTIGCIDLFEFDARNKKAGVGILIADENERKKGYAREALECVIQYGKDILDLHQLFANVLTDNQASLQLFQTMGFVICGEKKDWVLSNGKWKNEMILQKILI